MTAEMAAEMIVVAITTTATAVVRAVTIVAARHPGKEATADAVT
jgi:hypothetical protein